MTDTWDADVRIEIVSDIQGIYAAHSECAKRSQTENFFVVDADAWLMDSFDISYDPAVQPDVYPVSLLRYAHMFGVRKMLQLEKFMATVA